MIKPEGRSRAVANLMDIYRTFAELSGSNLDPAIESDSQSLVDILLDPDSSQGPSRAITFFYCGAQLNAVRYKNYKIHFYAQRILKDEEFQLRCKNGISNLDFYVDEACRKHSRLTQPLIYDVEQDPGELFPLEVADHLDTLAEAEQLIEEHRSSIDKPKSGLLDRKFMDISLAPCCNPPYCLC